MPLTQFIKASNISLDNENLLLTLPGVYLINIYMSYIYTFSGDPTPNLNADISLEFDSNFIKLPTTYLSNTGVDSSVSMSSLINKTSTTPTNYTLNFVSGNLPSTFVQLQIMSFRLIATRIPPTLQFS